MNTCLIINLLLTNALIQSTLECRCIEKAFEHDQYSINYVFEGRGIKLEEFVLQLEDSLQIVGDLSILINSETQGYQLRFESEDSLIYTSYEKYLGKDVVLRNSDRIFFDHQVKSEGIFGSYNYMRDNDSRISLYNLGDKYRLILTIDY